MLNDLSRSTRRTLSPMNRTAAAIALAVATAAPAVLLPSAARASLWTEMDEALLLLADQAKPTDPELLAQGAEEYGRGQYEEAQVTLQQVRAVGLSQADQARFGNILKDVESALANRQKARADFERGEVALDEKNYDEAVKHYRAAAENKFADPQTRAKAEAQIAVAQASQNGVDAPKQDLRALYREAVAAHKAERYEEAREKFTQLRDAGYKGGLLDRKPDSFLKEIDRKLAVAAAPEVVAPEVVAEEPEAPPVARISARDHYDLGKQAYRQGEFDLAREHFTKARDMGLRVGFLDTPPQKYLTMIQEKTGTAVAVTPEPDRTDVVPAPVPPAPSPDGAATTAIAPEVPPDRTLTQAEQDLIASEEMARAERAQRVAEANRLVEQALAAQREGRSPAAYDLYSAALRLDPSNQAAAEGRAELRVRVTGERPADLIGEALTRDRIRQQEIQYTFGKAIDNARAAIAESDFDKARSALVEARVAMGRSPEIFSREQIAAFHTEVEQVALDLDQRELAAAVARGSAAAETAREEARRIEELREAEQRRTIRNLVRRAQELTLNQQYEQALGVINQILAMDPNNDYAIGVRQLVSDKVILSEQRKFRELSDRELERHLNRAEEGKVPYFNILEYPPNWVDISETRDREVLNERRVGAEDAQVIAQLDRPISEVKFSEIALADAIEFFRDVTGANIFVNWRTIEAAGVTRTQPVTVRLRDIKFSKALDVVLADAGGGQVELKYTIADGVISISTKEELGKATTINVYDIRDLLVVPPDVEQPPDFSLSANGDTGRNNRDRRARTRDAGGGGGGLFPAGGGAGGGGVAGSPAQRADDLVQEIQTLIKDTVDRDSWVDQGGTIGTLRFLSGQLIVTQTPENQRQLVALLDMLRAARAIQVTIETRFLQVQRNYMEDVGLDLDFFFNINSPNRWTPIQVDQNSSDFTLAPTTAVPGSIGAAAQPGMQITGSFLDDFQVNFLIRATQASQYSTILTAPRVTVFNGQQAFVVVAAQQAYISDLEAVTGDGVGLFNPVVDTVQSGVRLVVQPTVSADRKYVTLSLQPQVSQLVALAGFPVFGTTNNNNNNNNNNNQNLRRNLRRGFLAAANGGGDGGGDGDGNGEPPPTVEPAGQIQLPLIQLTSVNTIVSVPDQGTLLLGGQTLAGEVEKEEGVPILSKIPFLKRLFTNRSMAKDEQILLILVKPTIIIQREIEQQKFPMLGSKLP